MEGPNAARPRARSDVTRGEEAPPVANRPADLSPSPARSPGLPRSPTRSSPGAPPLSPLRSSRDGEDRPFVPPRRVLSDIADLESTTENLRRDFEAAEGLRRRSNAARRSNVSGRAQTVAPSRARAFSLAGPDDTPQVRAAHEPFVHPGYSDLNPSYDQPANSRPVWSLAKPLPRVVRPGMVPTKQEVVQAAAKAQLPAENSQNLGLSVAPDDLEKGRVQKTPNIKKISAQVKDARQQRENNFLNNLQPGLTRPSGRPSSRMSAQSSAFRRPQRASTWNMGPDVFPPTIPEVPAAIPEDASQEEQETKGQQPPQPSPFEPTQTRKLSEHLPPVPEGLESPEEDEKEKEDDSSVMTLDADYSHFPDDLHPLVNSVLDDEVHNNHTSWSVVRTHNREGLAELLAVAVQLTIGFSADLAVTVAHTPGNPNTTDFAWGFAAMIGIYISGGISGAHLNPVITIMLWFFRGFPKRKMPAYFAAQFLGAFIAALIAHGLYAAAIQDYLQTNSTAGVIASFVTSQRFSFIDAVTAFFNEFIATAILTATVLALGDDQNAPPGAGMNSLIIGLVITALSMAFSYQTGAALNPSRDFGPRLALLALGYGRALFTNPYWFYGPWAGALCGGVVGAFLYDTMIFTGGESPINYPWTRTQRAFVKGREKWKKRLGVAPKET
ncbi:MAG: hypothetical protein M1821_007303 [Bathelium mastoideum]|nr:MAG: hypothetical protein M1821_007303 [Bathelium mastoideum]